MEAGHEGGPARRADGVDVVVVEDDARVSQGVDVGRGHLCGNSIQKCWLEFMLQNQFRPEIPYRVDGVDVAQRKRRENKQQPSM